MRLHTVVVSYNRPELLRRTIESYRATVTVPHSLFVVDNGSDPETLGLLDDLNCYSLKLGENHYPGRSCNIGFGNAPRDATHLHRSDNDMEYLPGWCAEVRRFFDDPRVGQVGLRTLEEEAYCDTNVGGTAVFRRELWEAGMRYRTDSWAELQAHTEDYWISLDVVERGYRWTRVEHPCVIHLGSGDLNDPYYQESFGVRGLIS